MDNRMILSMYLHRVWALSKLRIWTLGITLLALSLLATACGGSADTSDADVTVGTPTEEPQVLEIDAGEPADVETQDTTVQRSEPAAEPSETKPPVEALEQSIPSADTSTKVEELVGLQSQSAETFETQLSTYMTSVIQDVDAYWTRTFAAAGYVEPRVSYVWLQAGEQVYSQCGLLHAETAAAYCPDEDIIYIGTPLISTMVRGGRLGGQPDGRLVNPKRSSFVAAYVVAHEYAHQIQAELGQDEAGLNATEYEEKGYTALQELEADCYAGAWANSLYYQGYLTAGDQNAALTLAAELGDHEMGADFHGTPEQRVGAWQYGYDTGSPADCQYYYRTRYGG